MAEVAPAAPAGLPAGNPQSALYNETLAALQHQREGALASDKQARGETEGAYKTGVQSYNVAEPKALSAEQNKANNAGLLESGINARERGSVLGSYVEKRGALATKEQSNLNKLNLDEQKANESYSLGVKNAATKALEEYKKEQEALAPTEPQSAAPPSVASISPQPAGVATNAPGLSIRNPGGTAQRTTRSIRRQAARRAA
jgi:hypothetical protein